MSLLYDTFARLCAERGLSVSAACRKAGVSPGILSDLKTGRKRTISVDTAARLAAALGVSPADCVIFEDARAGFEAARRAGAGRIVALTTTLPREELEREPQADRIIDSFADIDDIGALLA